MRIGTIFESRHAPMHIWLQVTYMICSSKKGFPTRQIQRTLNCSMKIAWFFGHRVRECMAELGWPDAGKMGGGGATLEADETFIGGKVENRAYGPIPPKQAVCSLVQRRGRVRSFHIPGVTAMNFAPIIARHAPTDSRFMTDDANVYDRPGRWFVDHQTVNHSAKEYVRDVTVHPPLTVVAPSGWADGADLCARWR